MGWAELTTSEGQTYGLGKTGYVVGWRLRGFSQLAGTQQCGGGGISLGVGVGGVGGVGVGVGAVVV